MKNNKIMETPKETLTENCNSINRIRPKNLLDSINNNGRWMPNIRYEQNDESKINEFISKRSAISAVEKNSYMLWIVTPLAASFSVIMVIAALAGPVWLITEERLITSNLRLDKEAPTMSKCTKSSLWIICSAILTNSTNCTIQSIQDVDSYNCIKIDYFPKEEYRADAHDSTSAIPYTIITSCPFFLTSGIILIVSFIVFLIPTLFHQNNLYYFTAGILFIVSGLLMLIGLIVYISIFKTEIGSKLRSKSAFEPPIFKFSYGQSFFLYVFGFIFTEFVGLLNVFLYISLLEVKNSKEKIPCLPFLTFGKNTKNSLKTCQKLDPQLICKKHAIPINLLFDSESGKRYYFEKIKKFDDCNSQNLAKSLNELYTEPAPTFSSFDLSLYKGSPPTRSVSTTTEIFLENNKREFMKNQQIGSKEYINDMCGLSSEISRGIRKTKDDLVNEFFKRTGVKPKPKNIYFIENRCDNSEENIFVVDNYSKNKKNQYSLKELTRINSNPSLRNQCGKFHTKSLISLHQHGTRELDRYNDRYFSKNGFHNDSLYQSQTLPRSFMKRNYERNQNFNCSIGGPANFHTKNSFNSSNTQLCRSCGDIEILNDKKKPATAETLTIQWPQAIPASPSYSIKSTNFYNRFPSGLEKVCHHLNSNINDHKKNFISSYSNNNYQISNLLTHESFDLDQIEKDCRLSHANLFKEGNYDTINGTAV